MGGGGHGRGAGDQKDTVYLFEAAGLLRDPDDPASLIPHVPRYRIGEAMPFARGRMKKKLLGAKRAIEAGVDAIYFGDGAFPDPSETRGLDGKGTVIN